MALTFQMPPTDGGMAVGHYISQQGLEHTYGSENVSKWADRDNDGDASKIRTNVQAAIDWAEAEIDGAFGPSMYEVPLRPVTPTVTDWARRLAAWHLYRARGMPDEGDAPGGKLAADARAVRVEMGRYISGVARGEWTRSGDHATGPDAA